MAEDTGTSSGESVYTEEEVTTEEGEGQTEGNEMNIPRVPCLSLKPNLHACPDGRRVDWPPPEGNANPTDANVASKEGATTNGTNGTSISTLKKDVKWKKVSETNVYHNSNAEMQHKSNYEPYEPYEPLIFLNPQACNLV